MNQPFFSAKTAAFLEGLALNNNREWFQSHRGEAERFLMVPARALVEGVGRLLRKQRPALIADPRINQSIYRLNRDTRFSKDKTPYKTHLALWWWEGAGLRQESPGFYCHFTARSLVISGGVYRFSPQGLAAYRQALLHKIQGARFKKITGALKKAGLNFSPPDLKRVPAGFDAGHPLAPWLRYKGFYTLNELAPWPPEITGPGAAAFLAEKFAPLHPLHEWLAGRPAQPQL